MNAAKSQNKVTSTEETYHNAVKNRKNDTDDALWGSPMKD